MEALEIERQTDQTPLAPGSLFTAQGELAEAQHLLADADHRFDGAFACPVDRLAQRYHHPHPRVQRKMEALLLKAKGLPHQQIASCVGIGENTLRAYLKHYQTGGIEALNVLQVHRPTSELEAYHDTIVASFQEHPVTTIPEAVKRIEEVTGIKRSPTQVGIFSKSWASSA